MKIIGVLLMMMFVSGQAISEELQADIANEDEAQQTETTSERGESLYIDNEALLKYRNVHINIATEYIPEISLIETEEISTPETEGISYEGSCRSELNQITEKKERAEELVDQLNRDILRSFAASLTSEEKEQYEGMSLSERREAINRELIELRIREADVRAEEISTEAEEDIE